MTDNPESRLQELFHAASDLPRQEQLAWLEHKCGDDKALLREVMSLLEHDFSAEDMLDAGVQEVGQRAEGLRRVLAEGAAEEPSETRQLEPPPGDAAKSRALNQVGKTVGPYKLLQRIGEGGMGTVYMAEQDQPVRRRVALKIIKPGLDTKQVIARFEAERQALAMMDHNHIARVLDGGATDDGHPYFAMELVKGIPITRYCDDNKLTVEERLELFIPVCHAIQHAHQKGIIHRDIKPSNVLVSMHDGKPVPKVIDFGVAKATHQKLTEKTMFTALGQVVGTLEYMSPEQAEMNQLDIDTRSDVYSLGVMLYELLTGTTPITSEQLRKAGISEVLKTIRQHEPPKPSTRLSESSDTLPAISSSRKVEPARLSRLLRGDLDWIVMKTLEKDRTRRYETANGLAADVQRYLDADPVEAGPPSASYRLQKFASKYRSLLVTGVVMSTILVIATCLSSWLAYRAKVAEGIAVEAEELASTRLQDLTIEKGKTETALKTAQRETKRAEINAARAESSERRTKRLLYRSDMREAMKAHQDFDQARVRDLLLRHLPSDDQEDNRDFVWNHLWNSLHDYDRQLIQGNSVERMDLSADGKVLMTRGIHRLFHFWDTSSGQRIGMMQLPTYHDTIARLSPDGTQIVHAGYGQHDLQIRNWRTLENIRRISVKTGRPQSVAWSADGRLIATVSRGGTVVTLYDIEKGEAKKQWTFDQGADYSSLMLSPDSRYVAHGSWHSKLVRVLDIKSDERWELMRPAGGYTREGGGSIRFSPDSRLLATCGRGGIELWDIASRKQLATYEDDSAYWNDIAWQPDGEELLVCGGNQLLQLSGTDLSFKQRFPGHSGRLTHIQVTPNERKLISSSIDGTVYIREIEDRIKFKQPFTRAEYRKDGTLVGVAKRKDVIEIHSQRLIGSKDLKTPRRSCAALRSDSRKLAFGHGSGVVSLWDLEKGVEVHHDLGRKVDSYTSQVQQIAFQPEGKLLAISTFSGTYLIDSDDFSHHGRFQSHRSIGLAFSPDGKHFGVGYGQRSATDQALRIYSVDSSAPAAILHATAGDILAIAFSEDGRWVASGGGEQVIRVSQWREAEAETRLTGHQAAVSAITFSPDGKVLISGDQVGSVRLWSTTDWELIAEIPVSDSRINHIDFSPDGTQIAIASESSLEIINGERDRDFPAEIEMTQMLAQNRLADFYSALAEREQNPQYWLNAAQHCYWRGDEAVQSQDYKAALDHLAEASRYLDRTTKLSQKSLEQIRTSLRQRTVLTQWGCHVQLGNHFDFDPEQTQHRCLLQPFYARTHFYSLNSAFHIGLSRFLRSKYRKNDSENEWITRLAPFLASFENGEVAFANAKVAFVDESGDIKSTYDLNDAPPVGSRLLVFGYDTKPVQSVMLQSDDFNWLSQEEALQSMAIDAHRAPTEFWNGLSRLKQLKTLQLKNWSGDSKESHEAIAAMTALESLRLDSSFHGFEHLSELKTFSNLKKLTLKESWLSRENVQVLRAFPHLTELELSLSAINDDVTPELAKMRHLRSLYIDGATVSEDGIRAFAAHPSLERLDLFEVPIGDDAIDTLVDLPKLQIAGLFKTNVSTQGVAQLRTARPNCLVMHHHGYLNVGKNPIPDLGLGSAPADTMYFPRLDDIHDLASKSYDELAADEEGLEMLRAAFLRDPNPEIVKSIYSRFSDEPRFFETFDLKTLQASAASAGDLSPGILLLVGLRSDQQTCLRFSGKEAWFDIQDLRLDPKSGVTIEAWVRPTGYSLNSKWGDEITVASTGDDYSTQTKMRFRPDRRWSANMEWPSDERGYRVAVGPKNLSNLPLTHLATVLSEDELSFYINGKLINRTEVSMDTFAELWRLGIGSGSGQGFFQGLIDEVRFSNSVRYSGDFVPDREFENDDQTVLLYHFDANPFGLAFDHSNNARHVMVSAEYVKLGEPTPAPNTAKPSTNVLAHLFDQHIHKLDQIDPAELPAVKPMLQYGKPPQPRVPDQTAIRFNGVDSHFTSPEFKLDADSGCTFEAWVKPEAVSQSKHGAMVLILKSATSDDEIRLKIAGSGTWLAMTRDSVGGMGAYLRSGWNAYSDPISQTPWLHVALVISGRNVTFFIDGKESKTGELPFDVTGDWKLNVGGHSRGQQVIGLIDEVRVSSTARYNSNFQRRREFEPDAHTILLYHFDSNDEDIIWDHSENQYHLQKQEIDWVDVP